MRRIAVLGGGAWGTALALTALRAGNDVSLWAREAEAAEAIAEGRNPRYLPDMAFETGIAASTDMARSLAGAEAVLAVVPAQSLRSVLAQAAPHLPRDVPVVLCAKGIESGTGKLLSEIAAEHRRRTAEAPGVVAPLLDAAFLVPTRRRARFQSAAQKVARQISEAGAQMTLTPPASVQRAA